MRILHFSDFHLRPNKQGERSMDIFDRMMDKLQEIRQEANIDLVIFSGDMIDKGGTNLASLWLNACKILKIKLYLHLSINYKSDIINSYLYLEIMKW